LAVPEAFRLDMEIRKIGQPNWSLMFYASGPGHRDVTGYTLRHFTFCLRSPPAFQLLDQQGRLLPPFKPPLANDWTGHASDLLCCH
jgi:hypothetical protein